VYWRLEGQGTPKAVALPEAAAVMSPGPTQVAEPPGRIASLSWSSWTRLT